jgi:sensor histidine kinase regulating citrate/malate metabolism
MELCRLVSCLSDNAIEAAAKSARKSVMIVITNNHQNSSKTITMVNSTPEPVDIGKITTLGHSTKEGHMGIGVNNAIKIAHSLESCHLEFSYYDYELTASLDIKNRPVVQPKTIFGTAFSGNRYKSAPAKKY